jgi:hypothetical protein
MSAMLLILIVSVPALVLVIGVVLTTLGLRGRGIDDHPLCRRCGFDLFGSSGSMRCPECGSELSAKVIRHGHRVVRRRPLTVGLILGIPSFLFLAGLCAMVVRGTDLEPYKPFWMLLREGDARAIAELNRREVIAGALSKSQEQRLLAAALDVQGDSKRPWLPGWGDLIEAMRTAGKVPDEDWRQYARQGVSFSVEIRPVLRRGDALPIKLLHGVYRMASSTRLSGWARVKRTFIDQVHIEGPVRDSDLGGGDGVYLGGSPSAGWIMVETVPTTAVQLKPLADGAHRFTADIDVEVGEGAPGKRSPVLASFTLPQSLPITLVAADARTVELVDDASFQPKIAACGSVSTPYPASQKATVRVNSDGIQGNIFFDHPPINLAFDVFIRDQAKHEWKLNPINYRVGERYGWGIVGLVPGLDSDHVEIVLRSSADAARGTIDLTRIWGGTVVLHNVKVIWQSGTVRPWDPLGGRETR